MTDDGTVRVSDSDDRAEIANRLHSLAIHLIRHVRGGDSQSGLSPARLSLLSVLVFAGARTVTELADAEQVTLATMSRLVRALEAEGYVGRAGNPTDSRSVIIRATAKGRRVLMVARRRRIARMMELLARLPEEEWTGLARALEALEGVLREE